MLILIYVSILTACQVVDNDVTEVETGNGSQSDSMTKMTEESENSAENIQDISAANETSERIVPTKEQVLATTVPLLSCAHSVGTLEIVAVGTNVAAAHI